MGRKKSRSIREVLDSANIEEKLSDKIKQKEMLIRAWEEAAGCSGRINDIELKNGILYVTVDSSAWHQELIMQDLNPVAEKISVEIKRPIAKIRIQTGGHKII